MDHMAQSVEQSELNQASPSHDELSTGTGGASPNHDGLSTGTGGAPTSTHTLKNTSSVTDSPLSTDRTGMEGGVANRTTEVEMELEATKEVDAGRKSTKRRLDVDTDLEVMDHSGLPKQTKKLKTLYKDGVMLCSPLSYDSIKDEPVDKVARALAHSLHEPKHLLIGDVVRVFGVEKTLGIFQQTATIQETGGTLTADGDKKKSPGGVFLTLVRQMASEAEKKDIFQKDKQIASSKKKRAKQQKYLEKERLKERERKRNAERQLDEFRSQLVDGDGSCPTITNWDCSLPLLPRTEKNIHKRLGKKMESTNENSKPKKQDLDSGQLQEESQAAEEFEQMSEYQLDFGIN